MKKDIKDIVAASLRKLLAPIVRMMLHNGMTYKEYAKLSKHLFVEVAAQDFGLGGRPTNVSRIALLTGLDRKEIKRVKDLLQEQNPVNQAEQHQDRMTRLLSAWHQDTEFVDAAHRPKILPKEGPYASFASLSRRFGGNVTTVALLKELIRAKVVKEQAQGVEVLKREFIPDQSDPEALMRASSVLQDVGSTLFHNLYQGDDQKIPLRFERRASNRHIDPKALGEFHTMVAEEGQLFLEKIDAWLSEHELSDDQAQTTTAVRAGVGTYLFEEIKPIDSSVVGVMKTPTEQKDGEH